RRRHHQFAAEPDGAEDGHCPRPGTAPGSAARRGVLVPLRAAADLRRPGRVGTAKPADRGPPDDRLGTGARGVPGDALSAGFCPAGRCQLATARDLFAAGNCRLTALVTAATWPLMAASCTGRQVC